MSGSNPGNLPQIPGDQDTRPASLNRSGFMPRWTVPTATVGGFVTTGTGRQQRVGVDLATASVAGAVAAADFDKLHNWPKTRLFFVDAVDELTGGAVAANTEFTVTTAQNFTVTSTSSILVFTVALGGLIVTNAAGAMEGSVRLVVDLAGSPIRRKLSNFYTPGPAGAVVPLLGGSFMESGYAAGTHTVTVTARANLASLSYLRCNTQPELEGCIISIVELTP